MYLEGSCNNQTSLDLSTSTSPSNSSSLETEKRVEDLLTNANSSIAKFENEQTACLNQFDIFGNFLEQELFWDGLSEESQLPKNENICSLMNQEPKYTDSDDNDSDFSLEETDKENSSPTEQNLASVTQSFTNDYNPHRFYRIRALQKKLKKSKNRKVLKEIKHALVK